MNEYGRWSRRRLRASLGPVQKCSLCKTVWLYGMDRRRMGICTRCERIALKRKEIIDIAHESTATEEVKWVDGWPGQLEVVYARQYGRTITKRYMYVDMAGIFDLATFLAVERNRLLRRDDE